MYQQIVFRPNPVEPPDQPSPEALAVLFIARRARVSQPHAAVIARLAGIGPQEVRR
jgi:hypothetical protein